ncbi:MAG: PGF-pre-PGF domain-containing protein [Candidatus Methanoperedens sp.]
MSNKILQSSLIFLVYLTVILSIIPTEAYAVKITIKPDNSIISSMDDSYSAKLEPTYGEPDFFFLNLTIPAGYKLNLPLAGAMIGNYTMYDSIAGKNKVIINITSRNPDTGLVNIVYSTDYGLTYRSSNNQNIENMTIGASNLKIINSTDNTPGYLNLTLGGTAGPIRSDRNKVNIILNIGTLRNPTTAGTYTWKVVAFASLDVPRKTDSFDVNIKTGASEVVIEPLLDNNTPAEASLPLPAGNLTVNITTIPGVVVTNLVMTLRNFTDDPMPEQTRGASGLSRVMFIGIDVPALQGVTFTAKVSVNYSSVVSKLTIPEANLKLYHFNVTSSTWEAGSNNTVDTVNKIVSADFNSFSTFAVMGAAASGGGNGGSGGGGGGGGGGLETSEPYGNIAKAERYDKSLIANTPVTYTFKAPELAIYEIVVTDKENEDDIAFRVEALNGASKLVTFYPPGTVYKNVNIWAGTKRIKEALIRFKVENTWLGSNNFAGSDIKMIKWDGSKWVQIETAEKTMNSTYTYYEAKTDSFSSFAITGLKGVVVPTATPAVEETITPTEAATPTVVPTEEVKKVSELSTILSITLVILIIITTILAAVYLSKRNKG